MKPTLYTTLLTMVWSNPSNPEVYPTVPPNYNADHQDQPQIQYEKWEISYKNTVTMDKSLKNQVIDSVKDM